MQQRILFLFVIFFFLPPFVRSQETEMELTDEQIAYILSDSIQGEKGRILQTAYHFCVDVPEGYQFLDKEKANHLLSDYWGNPQDDDMLGALVSDTALIYYDVSTAYVISYDNCGYVSDKDATDINYDDLLKDLQKSTLEGNKERIAKGYEKVQLVGWAIAPQYDKRKKALCWAKHLRFGDDYDVLNYDIRILGKDGYVIMQAVADLSDCDQIIAGQNAIISSVIFDKGYAYTDFNPKKDHVAEWTIGGLIAGKVLAKAGLFAKLSVLFLKFWKLILIGFAAIATPLFKLFNKSKQTSKDDKKEE